MVHRHTAALHRERGWLSAEHPWSRRHRQHSRRAGRRDHDHLHRLHPAHDAWRRLHHEPTQIRALRHRRPQPAIRLAAFRPVRHPRPYRRGLTDALDTGLSAYGTSRNHQFPPRRSAGRHHHDEHLQTGHRPIHHAGDQQTRQRRVLHLTSLHRHDELAVKPQQFGARRPPVHGRRSRRPCLHRSTRLPFYIFIVDAVPNILDRSSPYPPRW